MKGHAVLFSEMTPPEGGEEAFNRWYDGHHTPNHVHGVPGFRSAMRYKSPEGPNYLAVYELHSPEVLESDEYRSRKFTPDPETKAMLDSVSGFSRYICREVVAVGREGFGREAPETLHDTPLDAPVVHTVFFAVPPERAPDFDAWYNEEHLAILFKCPDWRFARRFEIVAADPEPFTHLAIHYLGDGSALESEAVSEARATPWRARLAAEPWFKGRYVRYDRRGDRFLKSG